MKKFPSKSVFVLLIIFSCSLGAEEKPLIGFNSKGSLKELALERRLGRALPKRMNEYHLIMTAEPHHAGTEANIKIGNYYAEKLKEFGFDEVQTPRYEVLLPRPIERSVTLISPERYELRLVEPPYGEDQDLTKDTLVVIISDHGIRLGEKMGERAYGAFCYDYTIRTFCSFISSGFQPHLITQQIRHVDFLPSIIDFLGIPFDETFSHFDGQSIIPLFYNKKIPEEIAFTETANQLSEKMPPKKPNTKCVRTSNWKLIFNEYDDTKELYNLQDDPNEENNLYGKSFPIEDELWNKLNMLSKS